MPTVRANKNGNSGAEEQFIQLFCDVTDAGHEIKTPITIIGADLEILRMELGKNE